MNILLTGDLQRITPDFGVSLKSQFRKGVFFWYWMRPQAQIGKQRNKGVPILELIRDINGVKDVTLMQYNGEYHG